MISSYCTHVLVSLPLTILILLAHYSYFIQHLGNVKKIEIITIKTHHQHEKDHTIQMLDLQDYTKDQDNTISMDYVYRGSLYKIKILDQFNDDPDTETKSRCVERILLAKKQSDKYWRLMYIRALNYRIERNELLESDHDIHIDMDNYSVMMIDEKKSKSYEKMCDSFLRRLPEYGDFAGYPITLKYQQLIYYFYQWIAKKRTIDEIASCEIR
jgi:hypothetical protein